MYHYKCVTECVCVHGVYVVRTGREEKGRTGKKKDVTQCKSRRASVPGASVGASVGATVGTSIPRVRSLGESSILGVWLLSNDRRTSGVHGIVFDFLFSQNAPREYHTSLEGHVHAHDSFSFFYGCVGRTRLIVLYGTSSFSLFFFSF